MPKKQSMEAATVYAVAGEKGGVGKSTFARALAERLMASTARVEIIDGDRSNPDVAKAFQIDVVYNLNSPDRFMDIVNRIEAVETETPIVINYPAGMLDKAKEHSGAFIEALPQLSNITGRPLRTSWIIDDKRDGIESLKEFMELAPGVAVDIFRNLHFASPDQFGLFGASKTKAAVIACGGTVNDFPALASRVMARLTNERLTIERAKEKLPLGDRLELLRWWNLVGEVFKSAGYI